jgi:hypothetical protein
VTPYACLAPFVFSLDLFGLLFLLIVWLLLIILFDNHKVTIFKVLFCFFQFLHVFQNGILLQLMPEKVDLRAGGVGLFNAPPRSISFEQVFDQGGIVALSNIQSVLSFDVVVYFHVV